MFSSNGAAPTGSCPISMVAAGSVCGAGPSQAPGDDPLSGRKATQRRELAELTGLSKANVSQHLRIRKARGLVHCDKCGTFCHYRLTSPKVLETCEMVRQLILEQMDLTTACRRQLTEVVPLRKDSS